MNRRLLIPLVATVALLGLLYLGLGIDSRDLPSPLVGKPAPPFVLEALEDAEVTLTEQDFIGEVALVNVWATWCSTCRAEKPLLMELAQGGIPIHAFNYRDERESALRYLSVSDNPYRTIAYDPAGDAGIDWGVYATPETYVLDAEGVIRYKRIGPLTRQLLLDEVLPLVEKLRAESLREEPLGSKARRVAQS
ncbi:MAG: DsbE family thiol:disulfide interchange protein [Halomonas sp.]|uniref:DsbE family thiol:disulfide interchange protein n=1 Tax=Halomonas sulfidivorans TaxID=2733488 RepID=A0ABX7WAJ0_9GAMM|nr:DsbE family thiol:disulfide interchange protein [Halomonas sulfidivorans]MDX5378927.1 DsbE family thiol:disulfide interchange protein [Halomonas sp.]MDX5503997.1 DsbE family thiol:disulfide interchange protein [Halomonas sp.]QTP57348.1 DsbE family thiol:disulfide interchange protein [Halomonas sulfidivorans]